MSTTRFRVLVVDDHSLTRDLVRAIVRHLGLSTVSADSGKAALQKLREQKFNLIICDWMMPDIHGIEVLREVRSDEKLKDIPFVLLTAETSMEKVHAAIEAGANDYIVKPFNTVTIGRKLRAIIEKTDPEVAKQIYTTE